MDIRWKNPAPLIAACLGLAACEAGLAGSELVEVVIPQLPASFIGLGDVELLLRWWDEAGRTLERPVSPGECLSISLPRHAGGTLLVEAWHRGRRLRPAGALYPEGFEPAILPLPRGKPRLVVRWEDGWCASVWRLIEEAGGAPSYDFARLGKESAARLPDPWTVEPRIVAKALLEGSFRSDQLRVRGARVVSLPGPGPWFPDSPLAQVPQASESGYSTILGTGLWHFYSRGLELFVACGTDSEPVMLIRDLPP